MRRHFETSDMLEAEHAARERLARQIKKPIHKISDGLWGVDWAVYTESGELYGFIEFKKRNHKKGQYPDVRMSGMKYLRLKQYAETFGVKSSIVVEFTDCVGIVGINDVEPDLVAFGRTSNFRDEFEVEPCISIPCENFMVITDET